jgi:hypothetical protein
MARNTHSIRWAWTVAALAGMPGVASAQTFVLAQNQIPSGANNNSTTEDIDFGDVDLDGDFDAIMADGGDDGNDQNRIWINLGGVQAGTIGFYQDETATRLPVILNAGRDIEFGDIDNDGDLDVHTSNDSQASPQTSRWQINQGLLQGGSMGFYADETAARWVGLNSPNSSLAPNQILGSGGFIDFSADGDFADLDNDGDIDLVHSSYGGAMNGQIPTRIFMNDGLGFFSEHNPSGFKLAAQTIQAGNPALWAEGTHQSNTVNSTGVTADVASNALDIDLGDVDGDFDFDILHGALTTAPRFFQSRLAETGFHIYRDVTGVVYPAGYTSGNGHYEQEFGDFDNDNDLDIFGLNWFDNHTDETLANNGAGVFGPVTIVPNSAQHDSEGEFGDYDNDGDLDLLVTTWGASKLYRNDLIPSGTFSYTPVSSELPVMNSTSTEADWGDIDNDGDYDIMVANIAGQANRLLENVSQIPDTSAPRVVNLEQAPDRVSSVVPTVVRVHVYDNAAYYVTWYNPTQVEYRVNGGFWFSHAIQSSQGQIFRAEIPGFLVGTIEYRVVSSDRYGNTTTSASKFYNATDGGGCNNATSTYCTSKPSSIPLCVPTIIFEGTASASAASGFLVATTPTPGANAGLFLYTTNGALAIPTSTPFGFICLQSPFFRVATQNGGGNNGVCNGQYKVDFNTLFDTQTIDPALVAGATVDIQCWYRDPPSPGGANLTNAGKFAFCQ